MKRVAISLLLLVGLPLLGLGASFAGLQAWKYADSTHWTPLGTPAVAPAEIIDGDFRYVYVRSQDGSLHRCDRTSTTGDNGCWRAVDQIGLRGAYVTLGDTYSGKVPYPPGEAAQFLNLTHFVNDSSSHARYALLEDGTIWYWDYRIDSTTSLLVIAAGPVCGLLAATLIVALLWLVAGIRALQRCDHVGIRAC